MESVNTKSYSAANIPAINQKPSPGSSGDSGIWHTLGNFYDNLKANTIGGDLNTDYAVINSRDCSLRLNSNNSVVNLTRTPASDIIVDSSNSLNAILNGHKDILNIIGKGGNPDFYTRVEVNGPDNIVTNTGIGNFSVVGPGDNTTVINYGTGTNCKCTLTGLNPKVINVKQV